MNEKQTNRASLNLRVADSIKTRVEEYARSMGLTTNAAAAVLLVRGLEAEERGDGERAHTPRGRHQ